MKRSIVYLVIVFLLCFVSTAVALDIDVDSNDAVDGAYGGTNRKTYCADGEQLLSTGTAYECLGTPDTDENGAVDLDEIGDPGVAVSWSMGALTLTIQGTTYNCVFSDGDLTCTGDGGITAPKFVSSGSNQMVTCTNAGTVGMDSAGEICYNSSTDRWEYWDAGAGPAAKEQIVGEVASATLENKDIDTTSGDGNSLIVTDYENIHVCAGMTSSGIDDTEDGVGIDPYTSTEVPPCFVEDLTNELYIRSYDGATDEGARFRWSPPPDVTGSTVKLALTGFVPEGRLVGGDPNPIASGATVIWLLRGNCLGDGDTLNTAFGDIVTLTYTASASHAEDDVLIFGTSGEITPGGDGLVAAKTCIFNVVRDADTDTDDDDVGLGEYIQVLFKRDIDNTW
jgi:hypothetical protein